MKDTPDAPEMFVSTASELIYIERNNSIESTNIYREKQFDRESMPG